MSNILSFLPAVKLKTQSEYAGPCPLCQGATKDGFILWINGDKGGRYLCRKCGAKGDAIDLVRRLTGASYSEACKALGLMPNASKASPLAKGKTAPPLSPVTISPPPEIWRTMAVQFLKTCQADYAAPKPLLPSQVAF